VGQGAKRRTHRQNSPDRAAVDFASLSPPYALRAQPALRLLDYLASENDQ